VDRRSGGLCNNVPRDGFAPGADADIPPPPPQARRSAASNISVER
jgi:hypothetical protein